VNINLKNDIKPISYIKTNAAEMMDYINENKNPIIITIF
jgi:PHD/YefM family antitoxin component YafN of YafNO toxin-antitoxin module